MSYEPTNWKDGDLVTSAKLNKMEQGIAAGSGGSTFVEMNAETYTLNKTWQEIYDAVQQGIVYIKRTTQNEYTSNISFYPIISVGQIQEESYLVMCLNQTGVGTFIAESPDDYPMRENGGSINQPI